MYPKYIQGGSKLKIFYQFHGVIYHHRLMERVSENIGAHEIFLKMFKNLTKCERGRENVPKSDIAVNYTIKPK